jgi:hypothetical protein
VAGGVQNPGGLIHGAAGHRERACGHAAVAGLAPDGQEQVEIGIALGAGASKNVPPLRAGRFELPRQGVGEGGELGSVVASGAQGSRKSKLRRGAVCRREREGMGMGQNSARYPVMVSMAAW